MTSELALAIASRLGGGLVEAKDEVSKPVDVLIGSTDELSTHRGQARFAVIETPSHRHDHATEGWSDLFVGEVPRPEGGRTLVRVISRYDSPDVSCTGL